MQARLYVCIGIMCAMFVAVVALQHRPRPHVLRPSMAGRAGSQKDQSRVNDERVWFYPPSREARR